MLLPVLFTKAKKRNNPSVTHSERIDKACSIPTLEYSSALKRKEILTPATPWMNLEDIMLSEISQTQKATYCVIPLMRGPRAVKSVQTESKPGLPWWRSG